MGTRSIGVAQIRSEMGQLGLDICALGIPALQCVDGKAMSQVVETGRMAEAVKDAGADAQPMPNGDQWRSTIDFR